MPKALRFRDHFILLLLPAAITLLGIALLLYQNNLEFRRHALFFSSFLGIIYVLFAYFFLRREYRSRAILANKLSDSQLCEFELSELVDQTAGKLAFQASQKGLTLNQSVDPEAPTHLLGDSKKIRQILFNLLGHSIKLTQSGSVTLSAEAISGAPTGTAFIRFSVSDTGSGISEMIQARYFAQTHDLKSTLHSLGGRFWMKSTLGVGTTFFVQIPLVLIEKSRTRPLRILVADDVEDNRLLIQLYLKQQSYHLDFAADGLQVLDLFSKNKYDLILLDVHMPHLSGYQAVEQIRRAEKNRNISRTPILALTANAMKEDVIRSIEAGCDRHLTKPITRDMLQRAIVESVTPLPGDHPIDPHPTLLLKKDLAPLIPAFLENRKRELERLGNSIQSKNFDEIHDIGHMIKGVAGTFGFRELSDLCRDLQIHAKAQNLPELEAIHARAKNYLEEVRIHFT